MYVRSTDHRELQRKGERISDGRCAAHSRLRNES